MSVPSGQRPHLRRADTQTPTRERNVFSTHSDKQAVPACHCMRIFKGIFSTRAFLNAPTRCLPMLKEASDIFRHASVFKKALGSVWMVILGFVRANCPESLFFRKNSSSSLLSIHRFTASGFWGHFRDLKRGQILYTPPRTPANTLLGVGGRMKEGGGYKIHAVGGFKIYIHTHTPSLKDSLWGRNGVRGGGI